LRIHVVCPTLITRGPAGVAGAGEASAVAGGSALGSAVTGGAGAGAAGPASPVSEGVTGARGGGAGSSAARDAQATTVNASQADRAAIELAYFTRRPDESPPVDPSTVWLRPREGVDAALSWPRWSL
jgi:hypothetical protein